MLPIFCVIPVRHLERVSQPCLKVCPSSRWVPLQPGWKWYSATVLQIWKIKLFFFKSFVSRKNFQSQKYVYILVFLNSFYNQCSELRKEIRWPTTSPTWTNMKLALTSRSPCCRSQHLRKTTTGLFVFLYMHYVSITLSYHTLTFETQLWKRQLKSISWHESWISSWIWVCILYHD